MQVVPLLNRTRYDKLHFVLGMVEDKDIQSLLEILPKNASYYFCKADIPRGMDAAELAQKAMEKGLKGEVFGSVKEALSAAQKKASDRDLVFVGGSTFTVAEVV